MIIGKNILGNDVSSIPLFCWIAAFTFKENSQLLMDNENNNNLYHGKITKTDFIHSIINGRHHNVDYADSTFLSYADLSGANLSGAILIGTNHVKNLPIKKEEAKSRGAIV